MLRNTIAFDLVQITQWQITGNCCYGPKGELNLFELTPDKSIVWNYEGIGSSLYNIDHNENFEGHTNLNSNEMGFFSY